jgi:hypothetical protein
MTTEVRRFTAADITFRPDEHEYVLPDGRVVPSVTQILAAVGVSTDFDSLSQVSTSMRAAIERKRAIGTALHRDAHAYDDNDLDESTVHPEVKPYLEAYKVFRQNSGVVPLCRERIVYHPQLAYAGTLDGIFAAPSKRNVLIDLKCGDPEDAACQFQTAGYQLAWEYQHPDGITIHERWGVQLIPGRAVPYSVEPPYIDWRDRDVWRAFVTTYYKQAVRRLR